MRSSSTTNVTVKAPQVPTMDQLNAVGNSTPFSTQKFGRAIRVEPLLDFSILYKTCPPSSLSPPSNPSVSLAPKALSRNFHTNNIQARPSRDTSLHNTTTPTTTMDGFDFVDGTALITTVDGHSLYWSDDMVDLFNNTSSADASASSSDHAPSAAANSTAANSAASAPSTAASSTNASPAAVPVVPVVPAIPAAADSFSDVCFVPSIQALKTMPCAPVVNKSQYERIQEYGTEIRTAIENGRPCIRDDHMERMSDCQHCSTVALFKAHDDHLAGRSTKGNSTAHKSDLAPLDHHEEWLAILAKKEVDKAAPSRSFGTAQGKHWVKSHLHIAMDGQGNECLFWGNPEGKERLIENGAGEKAYGLVLYDTAAAIKLHEIHVNGGKHLGRDATAKAFQALGFKAPGKSTIAAYIKTCPGCKDRTPPAPAASRQKKRGRQEAFGGEDTVEENARPAPKRSKAAPKRRSKATPEAALPAEPQANGQNLQAVAQEPQDGVQGPIIDPALAGDNGALLGNGAVPYPPGPGQLRWALGSPDRCSAASPGPGRPVGRALRLS